MDSDHDILISMRAEFRVKLESIESEIKNMRDTTQSTLADHETRIRESESWRWKIIGISAAAAFIVTLLVTWYSSNRP